MFKPLMSILIYLQWYISRETSTLRRKVTPFMKYQIASGAMLLFTLFVCLPIMIAFFLLGSKVPNSARGTILSIAICIVVILGIASSQIEEDFYLEFKKLDKSTIKKYDRFVWLFVLFIPVEIVVLVYLSPR